MKTTLTRRAVLAGAAGATIIVKRAQAADYKFSQYHNQTTDVPLHNNIVAMWDAIRTETNGRVEATVFPENNKLVAGDPAALKLLISGEIQFFTLMGGIIGTVVPVAEAQQVPFAFKSSPEAHKAIDGALGAYVGEEMAAKGMYLFPVAGFDNGMRQVTTVTRPVVKPDDLAGVKIRVPPGQMIFDTFQAFGAEPVTTPANLIYDAIKTGKVGAQENPLVSPRRLQDLRGGEVRQHDQSQLVRLQPDGASRHLERPARRHQGGDHPQRREVRAPAARRAGQAQRQPARDLHSPAASSSTRSTRRRSAHGCPASTRAGRTSSAPSAGACSKPRWASSGSPDGGNQSCDPGCHRAVRWPLATVAGAVYR